MAISKDMLVEALCLRYDGYSAEAVFEMACNRAALDGKTTFDAKELAQFRAALERVGDRVQQVLARVDAMLAGEPALAAPPDAKTMNDASPAGDGEATIVLRGVDAAKGEQILVCGAVPELGDWDPERARPMERDGDLWLARLKLPADTEVLFKFLRRTPGGKSTWEAGDNRSVRRNERVDATWRS